MMRWPLRNQILLPMVVLMLAALIGVSALNAFVSVQRTRSRIVSDLTQVSETLADSNFPLTDRVLEQMSGLASAEFVLANESGDVVASSTQAAAFGDLVASTPFANDAQLSLARAILVGDQRYFHSIVHVQRPTEPDRRTKLHVFYPEESYRRAARDVVHAPLLVGGAAIVLVIGCGLGIASRVTRPLRRLQLQVDEIAHGRFQSVPVPRRNDEIADLSRAINHMAVMLARYESEVRRNEQLRTLGQLGGGIAHQIRNAVTGCRLAIELHARECQLESESLDVATRQLELMEKSLRRFLSLGRSETRPHAPLDLRPIVENIAALVDPTARHVGVRLEWTVPGERVEILGDADDLEQLLVNLVLNAVEAASQVCHQDERPRIVSISLCVAEKRVELVVEDNGQGPAPDVAERLFEPFVTEKPDGTGLGLAVAREIATAHGGDIHWRRHDEATRFIVEVPLHGIEAR